MSDWTPPADAKKATPAASGWKPPSDAKKADGAPFPSAPPASGEEGLGGPAVSRVPSTNGYAPQPRHLETGGLRPFKGLDAAAPRRPQMTPTALSPNRGTREDGTNKGPGWLGSIPAADGKEMTELSFDFDVDGKNIFAPLLVPTLSEGEVALLASGGEPTDAIYKKAQDFAIQRLDQGKSPFKEDPRSIVKKEKAEEIDLIGADRTTQQPSTIQAPQFDITPATAKQKKKAEEDARIEDRYQSEFSSATEEEVQKAKSVNQSMRSSIPAMEGAFLEGVERLKQQGQLLTDQRQILDSMDPSDPAYQGALDQYNERVKAFRKEQSGIELEALVVDDLVKKSAIDEFLLNRREHAIKAGHGNIPAAMGYASLDMLGKSMAGTLDVIGKVIPTDQEILEFAGALPEGSGTESRKEWRNYLKDVEKAPTRLTGIDQFVTPEYVDKKKDESLFAGGLIAVAEMAPAIAAGMATGGAGMGASFFTSSYRDLDQEMQGEYWDQIPEAEKEAIKVGTSFVSAGLSTMGMKALAGKLPVVNDIFFRAARKFAPGMSPGQLRRIIDAETKSYVANVASKIGQGFAIEGTEELADYGQEELVKHLYENYKRDELGEKADTLFQNAESIDQLGEGAWKSFVIGGIAGNMIGGSVAALSSVGARKRLSEKEFGVFKDLLESGSLLKDIEPIMAAQVAAGEMSQSDFDKTMEDVSKAESAISQIPEGLDIKATREAFDLLLEKDKLKTKDKILSAPKMQKIDEKLQALVGVPKEEEAKTEPTKKKAGAPDTPSKTVEWEGKDVQPKEQVTTPNENEQPSVNRGGSDSVVSNTETNIEATPASVPEGTGVGKNVETTAPPDTAPPTSVQDEAPKPVAKKEAPSPGQGEGTTKSPYHSTSGKKYGGFSVTYDPEIGKMKTTMLGTPPPSGAEKFPAGSKERAKKSSNRIKAIRKARQEAEDELARKLGIAKDGRFKRGGNALEKREEEKERRAAISKKADRLDEDALGVYGVVLRVMADGDMKITPESIAKYLGWGGGRNDGAMAERRKTEEETKASWTLDDGGEHINNAAHGMMEGSTMKDADGDPMDGWSEADFAEAIAQVASGYTSSQEAYVQLERMADDLTEATLSPEDAITAHENAILNGLMEDADVEGNLDAAQASILNMSEAQLEAQYQDYLNTQRDENQEDTDGNDNQGAADSALGEQDDSGEEGASTVTEEDQDLADRISKLADDLDAPMAQRSGTPIGDTKTVMVDGRERTVFNSNGKPIHPTVEGVRNFWKWFKPEYRINTDLDGRPIQFYHGGVSSAEGFSSPLWVTPNAKDAAGYADRTAWHESLLEDEDSGMDYRTSDDYSPKHDVAPAGGQQIYPLYASSEKALDLSGYGNSSDINTMHRLLVRDGIIDQFDQDVLDDIGAELSTEDKLSDADTVHPNWRIFEALGVYEEAKKRGYDAVRITDASVTGSSSSALLVISPPTQIKSTTGNSGDFDPSNPSILAQKPTSTIPVKTGKLRTDRVAAALKKLVPSLEIIAPKTKEEYAEATKDISEGLGSTWGIYDPRTNKLYLNPSSPDLRQTFFHEAAHPIIIALAKNNPELFSKFYEQIRTEKGGKYIKFGQQYSDLSEAAQMAEALAEFFGDVAAGKVPVSTKPDSLYQQFKNFIKDILAALGWDMRSIDLSKPTDVREFAAQMKKAFDKGIAIEGFAPLEGSGQAMAQRPYGPIPADTHKAALNAVAASVRAGEGLSKAITNGLKEVKASDWYKTLDATQQAQAEADFKAPIKALATPVDKKPSTAPKKLQKQVMEAVGKKPAPKIVVNEKAALKDQIRMAAKNIRGERTRIAAARKEFVAAIKEAFKGSKGDFTAKQAAVVAHRAASVDPTNDLQVSRFLDYANKVIDNAEWADQVERADIMRGRAAKASKRKSVPYNHKEVLKQASEVDPAMLENPGEYADIVQRYLGNIASPLSPQYAGTEQITEGEFQKYLSEWEAQMDQKYEDLLMDELGITVKKGQAKEIYKSIQEGTVDEALRQMDDPELRAEIESRVREMSQQRIAALEQHDTSGLNKEEVRIVKDIASADIDRLTVAQQVDIIRASDNIILNNGFGGATLAASIASASNAVKPALDIAAKSGIRRALGIAQEFFSQSDAWTFFFGQAKDVGKIQNLVGFGDYVRGKAEFMKEQKKVRQDMEQFFSRLRAKYKDADSFENMTAEWVAGWVIQAMPKLNPKQSFEANKAMLQEDINRKMPTKSKKEAEMAQTVFDKIIAPANSREEALALLAKNYPSAKQSIDFMVNLFKPYRDRIQANSVRTWNMSGDYSDPYYLPKAFFTRGAKSLDVEPYSNKKNLTTMRPGQAGGTKARMTYRSLAENRLISPNIRNNVFSSLSDDLYGVATDAARMRLNEFMKMPDSNGVFGNEENKGFMAAMMHNYITAQDKSSGDQSEVSRWVNNRINDARTLASVQALAGFTQITRQLPEAVTQASVMMGRDFPLLFKNIPEVTVPSSPEGQGAANLMGNYAIGSREHAKAGMAWEGKVNSLNNAFQKAMQSGRFREAMKIRAKTQELFMMSLMKGDLLSARAAWLGFYEKARKMDGHEVESWQTEASMHEGDASRQDAALYADTMVNRMTVSSDPAQAARIAQRTKSPTANAFKALVQAFVGTAIQQVGRRYAEVSTLGGYAYKKATGEKTGEAYDPKRALMSLVAGTAGNAVFLGSRLLIASALREAIGELYKWAVDDDDDEEPSAKAKTVFGVMTALYMAGMMDSDIFRAIDKVERDRGRKPKDPESESVKKYKLFKSQMLSEFIGSSIWQIADDAFIDGLNRMAYSAALDAGEPSAFTKGGDSKPFRTWLQDPKNAPFYRYGQTKFVDRDRWIPDLDDAGILGVFTKNAGYMLRNINNIFGDEETEYKNEYQKAVKDIREASKERTEKASDIVARYEAGELTKEQSNKEFEKAFKGLPVDEYNKAVSTFLEKRRYIDAPDNVKEILDINNTDIRAKMAFDLYGAMSSSQRSKFDKDLDKAKVKTKDFMKEFNRLKSAKK